jgi:AraC-like DNA-binding protein
LMEEQKMYKNPHLALRELSNSLSMPSYIVTKALNEVLGVNFYDLVNKYRVEEAKQLLTDPTYDRFTILRVASDAGFNSKTTFNEVFRKFTGVTPSRYRTSCRISLDVHSDDLVTLS